MNVDESCGSVNTKMDKAPHRGERERKKMYLQSECDGGV
jgi:hypothetical protein